MRSILRHVAHVLGALGLPLARNAQTWIHRRLRARSGLSTPYDPLGWHNQMHMTGEQIAGIEDLLLRVPSPIVFDHLGLGAEHESKRPRQIADVEGLVILIEHQDHAVHARKISEGLPLRRWSPSRARSLALTFPR